MAKREFQINCEYKANELVSIQAESAAEALELAKEKIEIRPFVRNVRFLNFDIEEDFV